MTGKWFLPELLAPVSVPCFRSCLAPSLQDGPQVCVLQLETRRDSRGPRETRRDSHKPRGDAAGLAEAAGDAAGLAPAAGDTP